MVKIISHDRSFTIFDGDTSIGLKRGDASYKVVGDNLKLYWVDDWLYKFPIKCFDLPVEINGVIYDKSNIDDGLVVIFPEKQSGSTCDAYTKEEMDAILDGFYDKVEMNILLDEKSDVGHKHVIADITDWPVPVYDGRARLTLNDGSIVEISGSGTINAGDINPYEDTVVSAEIGSGCTNIGGYAFYQCFALTSITIPSSVTTISDHAIDGCTALTSVTIPSSVTSIGDYAFVYCNNLREVNVKAATPPTLGIYAFDKHGTVERYIYVPATSVDAYKAANNWSRYASAIQPAT